MSKLIVVCGLSGSGKTTLSTALSRKLNVVCIHKDSLKASVYDQLGIVTQKAFMLFKALVEEQLENGVDIIIEATFDFAGDEALLKQWEEKYELELTCIVCQVSASERRNRILTRERHISHRENDVQQLARVENHAFDYSVMPGRHILVTTDEGVEKSLGQVLASLR